MSVPKKPEPVKKFLDEVKKTAPEYDVDRHVTGEKLYSVPAIEKNGQK